MTMKLDPRDLINLPGAGNAEKALRKAGLWLKDPNEIVAGIIEDMRYALEDLDAVTAMEADKQ